MPTSAALVVHEHGDLNGLRDRALASSDDPTERAKTIERSLSSAWRINQKIACMFASLLAVPDLGLATPPWSPGLDWSWFVVVDSNVDLFLETVGYEGSRTYDARREYIRAIADRIDLSTLKPGLHPTNPRLVQQAMYMFMSRSNRQASAADCSRGAPTTCAACSRRVRSRCSLQPR